MKPRPLDHGLVGNCAFSALVDRCGRIAWCCLPRFDSDPVFHRLLGTANLTPEPRGFWNVELPDQIAGEQEYIPNTAILVTRLRDTTGNAVEIAEVETMEYYLRYLHNAAASGDGVHLQPVYGITLASELTERELTNLAGFEHVGEQACERHRMPDAGMWELRTRASVHTSSALMCWAACDRLANIARHVGLLAEDSDFETGEQWGNFPQTYSHAGIINAAVRLSGDWESVV